MALDVGSRIAHYDVTALIPDVGHNPHEEAPDIVNAELISFLAEAQRLAREWDAASPQLRPR